MTDNLDANRKALPSWRGMHMDTAPWAEKLQLQFFREAPAWRKLQMSGQLTDGMLLLAKTGIQARYPNASPPEVRRRLADTLLGPEVAAKVYGPLIPSHEAPQ